VNYPFKSAKPLDILHKPQLESHCTTTTTYDIGCM